MIEGPDFDSCHDFSYFLVDQCKLIKRIERGIKFDPYLLLAKNKVSAPDAHFTHCLDTFMSALKLHDACVEYKILARINCHKQKYDDLFKCYHGDFKQINLYPDILPFENNRVRLSRPKDPVVANLNTNQAALSNLSGQDSQSDTDYDMTDFKIEAKPLKRHNSGD